MRRSTKSQPVSAPVPVRKAVTATSVVAPSSRRGLSVAIDPRARGVALAATPVTSRVRDGLVLRVVGRKRSVQMRNLSHGPGAR